MNFCSKNSQMEGLLIFKVNGQTISIDRSGKKVLQEAVDEAFAASKLQNTHIVKSVHVGHVGAKCLPSVAHTSIDSVDQTKHIHLVLMPKHYLVIEDDEHCLESIIINSSDLSRRLCQLCSSSDVFRSTEKPINALKVFAHIGTLRLDKSALDAQYNGFYSEMLRYYDLEKERVFPNGIIGNSIRFEHLGFFFIMDTPVVIHGIRDTYMGGTVLYSSYHTSMFGGTTWCATVQYTQFVDNKLGTLKTNVSIGEYEGHKPFAELKIEVLSKEYEEKLKLRGEQFLQYTQKDPQHRYYDGTSFYKYGYWSLDKTHVKGRVMIDPIGFNENNANYTVYRSHETDSKSVTLWTCWPTLPAFCLTTMTWGEVHVDLLKDIVFNEQAFDRLVIEEDQKQLIRAIVENPFQYQDLVEGKSMGSIFLLHGPPGVGKTSSAEAVAEVLKRPLYKFTSGQLGVTPTELHNNLNTNLKLAQRWHAVALIDEVDIYLERRSDNDIVRNAMVGIFLNLLEYYQGTLFLTTNRVKCFDEAFQSRISIALHYEEFNKERRSQVWKKHLHYAKLDHLLVDCDLLGSFNLNGRQIGTCIRIAISLATSEGLKQPTYDHLKRVILLNEKWINK